MRNLTTDELRQFTGTECWHRHGLARNLLYTDGVKFMAERGGAYWLIDVVASVQHTPKVRGEEFQLWTLKVAKGRGVVTCDDGNGKIIYRQDIPSTDFPLPEMQLYFEDNVLMLPSER
jgi:hypothetical protein